jgi:hypothetical protein
MKDLEQIFGFQDAEGMFGFTDVYVRPQRAQKRSGDQAKEKKRKRKKKKTALPT